MRTEIAVVLSGCAMAIGIACGSSGSPASPSATSAASTTSTGLAFRASGTVTEVPPGFNALAGVRVEIVSGPGKHDPVTTDGSGTYDFGTLPNGNYTFLATREGYQDLTRSVLLNRSMNNIDILLYPVPPPGATARCKDKSWSYATDKGTACMPRNGGVSYFVCPGPLC